MDAENQESDIVVQIASKFTAIDICLARLEKLVKAICCRFDLDRGAVSIALIDDTEIRKLNKQFLGRDCSTDCLSFDLSDEQSLDTGSGKVFELIINAEKAVKEAKQRGHSSEAELALYVTHSMLHNLGFDDSGPEEAKKMHDMEDEILQQLGFGSVYNSLEED